MEGTAHNLDFVEVYNDQEHQDESPSGMDEQNNDMEVDNNFAENTGKLFELAGITLSRPITHPVLYSEFKNPTQSHDLEKRILRALRL